jgi:hypothetical protein
MPYQPNLETLDGAVVKSKVKKCKVFALTNNQRIIKEVHEHNHPPSC